MLPVARSHIPTLMSSCRSFRNEPQCSAVSPVSRSVWSSDCILGHSTCCCCWKRALGLHALVFDVSHSSVSHFLSVISCLFLAYQLRVCQHPAPVANAEVLTDDDELEIGKSHTLVSASLSGCVPDTPHCDVRHTLRVPETSGFQEVRTDNCPETLTLILAETLPILSVT